MVGVVEVVEVVEVVDNTQIMRNLRHSYRLK